MQTYTLNYFTLKSKGQYIITFLPRKDYLETLSTLTNSLLFSNDLSIILIIDD